LQKKHQKVQKNAKICKKQIFTPKNPQFLQLKNSTTAFLAQYQGAFKFSKKPKTKTTQ